jgi:hypothetical protein
MRTVFGHDAPLPGNNEPYHLMDTVVVLGRTLRFGGNAGTEWTVLHHTVLVSLLWLGRYGAEGVEHAFLHDLHESITGDIPTPVKNAIGRPAIDKVQDDLDSRLYAQLDIDRPDPVDANLIKYVDSAALLVESYHIGAPNHLQHLIDTSVGNWSQQYRTEVHSVVSKSFPEVADKMTKLGFFESAANTKS